LGSFRSFESRKRFKEMAYAASTFDQSLLFDFMYENPLYGKVDHFFDTVYPIKDSMVPFRFTEARVFALPFVVDAFEALQRHIHDAHRHKKINLNNSFLRSSKVVRAYSDPEEMYRIHLEGYIGTFSTEYLFRSQLHEKIYNFHDFFREFRKYLSGRVKKRPLTMSGFVKSKYCTNAISGLFLEISEQRESVDSAKYQQYISDINFSFYVHASRKFGFYIDRNCPWRLIADVSSSEMYKYMRTYQVDSVQELFSSFYIKSFMNDIYMIKTTLFDMYNDFVREFPVVQKSILKGCSEIRGRASIRNQSYHAVIAKEDREFIELSDYSEKYTDLYWLIFYFQLKCLEYKLTWDSSVLRAKERRYITHYKRHIRLPNSTRLSGFTLVLKMINNDIMTSTENRHKRFTGQKENNVISSY
jgi:hypothetical protein